MGVDPGFRDFLNRREYRKKAAESQERGDSQQNFSLDNDAIIGHHSAMMNMMEINGVRAVIAFDPEINMFRPTDDVLTDSLGENNHEECRDVRYPGVILTSG
jgi:hypothetical protein